jgi:type IV pilus assembly protein PilX
MNTLQSASRCNRPAGREGQSGAVRFVALVFLVLLTLLGLTASSTSILQERMTGGMRNGQLARMGAESALRAGEVDLWTAPQRSNFSSGGSAYPPCASAGAQPCVYQRNWVEDATTAARTRKPDSRVTSFRNSKSWLSSGSDGAQDYPVQVDDLDGDDASASLASQPRYLVEDLGLDTDASSIKGRMGGARLQELGGPGGAPKMHLYRVTARSQGGTDTVLRVAESVFGAYYTNNQFNPDAAPTP